MLFWIVPEEDRYERVEAFMTAKLNIGDRRELKALITDNVRVNGVKAKLSKELLKGDYLEYYAEGTAANRKSEVVYEDENFFVINKEQDVTCYTNTHTAARSLYDIADEHMHKTGEYNINTGMMPYICHAIDINNGGLVIVAKDEIYYDLLREAIRQRRIKRLYRCIISGKLPANRGEYADHMEEKKKFSKVQIVKNSTTSSRPVLMRYRLLGRKDELSLIEVDLVTDHTAQIRAQLAAHGMPVLGDPVYGSLRMNAKYGVTYPAIWGYRLDFEVGVNNPLEYLQNSYIEAEYVGLPYIDGLTPKFGINDISNFGR